MNREFKSFNSIERLETNITIWEKIDGTNSQIVIEDGLFLVGSRNRWITPENDNFGFAGWAYENKQALIDILGNGTHFGEWWGNGIQRKYNMKNKQFALFNQKHKDKEHYFIPQLMMCPVLYEGVYTEGIIKEFANKLKETGSVASPGFMNPEGVVARFNRNGAMFKYILDEVTIPKVEKTNKDTIDVSSYLQTHRLHNVLSKDEKLTTGYPNTLIDIIKLYTEDLEKETLEPIPEEVMKVIKRNLFKWVKNQL